MGQRYTEGRMHTHTHSCSRGVELHTLCLSVGAAVTIITRPSPCSTDTARLCSKTATPPTEIIPARLTRPSEANPKKNSEIESDGRRTSELPRE